MTYILYVTRYGVLHHLWSCILLNTSISKFNSALLREILCSERQLFLWHIYDIQIEENFWGEKLFCIRIDTCEACEDHMNIWFYINCWEPEGSLKVPLRTRRALSLHTRSIELMPFWFYMVKRFLPSHSCSTKGKGKAEDAVWCRPLASNWWWF